MKISDYYNSAAKLNLKTYQKDSAFNRILIQKPILKFWLTRLLKNEKNKSHSSIGDLGCGHGEKLALLLRQFPEVNNVFINDISTEMVKLASETIRMNFPEINLVANSNDLISDNPGLFQKCDLLLSIGVLNHIRPENISSFLEKLVLLTGKKLWVYFCHSEFILSNKIGASFKAEGVFFQPHPVSLITNQILRTGSISVKVFYPFVLKLISPMALIEVHCKGSDNDPN